MYERIYGMKYLLDTNVLIWCFNNPTYLPQKVLNIINNKENSFCISIISLWEIVIKLCINKLDSSITLKSLRDIIKLKNIDILPIKQKHLNKNLSLQMLHKDPFDRLLISIAISEKLPFITSDKDIHQYNVECIW